MIIDRPRVFIGTSIYEVDLIDYKRQRVSFSDGPTDAPCAFGFSIPNKIELKFADCILIEPTDYLDIDGNKLYAGDVLRNGACTIELNVYIDERGEVILTPSITYPDQYSFKNFSVDDVINSHQLKIVGNSYIYQNKWRDYNIKFNSKNSDKIDIS